MFNCSIKFHEAKGTVLSASHLVKILILDNERSNVSMDINLLRMWIECVNMPYVGRKSTL
ncbi:hypothetical protein Smp_124420 [Schistosoma mansoni]|uniref:DUF4283 domain-containing protein n=1 Tax=Schistosoma mansoni TaxID=6183 RepID=G4VCJ3_SCHMA|nr:hypothetical protein Smp_124420 [Schistosoma mansoni]|eukprot:XP_018650240.1 hypothetical protein Smp_124420 [Schistosoma mansoni]